MGSRIRIRLRALSGQIIPRCCHPAPYWPEREPLAVKLLARLKDCLSPEQYTAAWERGKSLDLNAALTALLDVPTLYGKS